MPYGQPPMGPGMGPPMDDEYEEMPDVMPVEDPNSPPGIMAEMEYMYEDPLDPLEMEDLRGGQGDWHADPEFNTGGPMPGMGSGMDMGMGMGMAPEGGPMGGPVPSLGEDEYDVEAIKNDMKAMLTQRAQERQAASDEFQSRALKMNQNL